MKNILICLMSVILYLNSGYGTTQSNYVYSKKIVKKSTVNNNKIGSQNNNIKYSNTTQESSNQYKTENNINQQMYNDKDFLDSEFFFIKNDSFISDKSYYELFNEFDISLLNKINNIIYTNNKLTHKELKEYIKIREIFLNTIYEKLNNESIYMDNQNNIRIKNTGNILINADELKCYQETGNIFCNGIENKTYNRKIEIYENEVIDKINGEILCHYREWDLYKKTKEILQNLNLLRMQKYNYKNSNYLALRSLVKKNIYETKK